MKKDIEEKIVSFIKKHPLVKFSHIYQNTSITKNHNSLKKYLRQLVESKKIIHVPVYDEYLVLPISKKMVNIVLVKIGIAEIINGINKLDKKTRIELEEIKDAYDLKEFNQKREPLQKQVLFKFFLAMNISLKLLATEGNTIIKRNRMKGSFSKEITNFINFEEKFLDFLRDYHTISKKRLKQLDSELTQIYHTNLEYARVAWKSSMPMNKILGLGIVENLAGTKEASRIHQKIMKDSNNRIYPKKMTSTKRRISELYTIYEKGEKIPDIDKILVMFQSNLGREGTKEVTANDIRLFLITNYLNKVISHDENMTPNQLKMKKKVEKELLKLFSSIS